jgi:hypothetical protein
MSLEIGYTGMEADFTKPVFAVCQQGNLARRAGEKKTPCLIRIFIL